MHTDQDPPDRPADRRRSERRRSVALLAAVPMSLLLMAGCGRLRHDSSSAGSNTPVTTAVTASPDQTTATSAVDTQTLDSIDQELAGDQTDLSAVNGDIQTANDAINSQEGDPSK
jgi:hypothetical protein